MITFKTVEAYLGSYSSSETYIKVHYKPLNSLIHKTELRKMLKIYPHMLFHKMSLPSHKGVFGMNPTLPLPQPN